MKSFAKGISEFGFFIIVTVVIRSGVGWERRKLMRKTIGRVLLMGSLLTAGGDRRHLLATHQRPTYSILMMKQK
jgi:hypothetical protein